MSYLFHVDVFMPASYTRPLFEGKLSYGRHAVSEATKDRYGEIALPEEFIAAKAKLIEVEFNERDDEVIKQVWRQPLDEKRDIVLVIGKGGFVKTVWINLRSDPHRTLNKARYVRR